MAFISSYSSARTSSILWVNISVCVGGVMEGGVGVVEGAPFHKLIFDVCIP